MAAIVSGLISVTDSTVAGSAATVSPFEASSPFVVGSTSSSAFAAAGAVASGRTRSSSASSLTILSSAGRLASGRSVFAEGEDKSSKGRLAEGAEAEVGEADIVNELDMVSIGRV